MKLLPVFISAALLCDGLLQLALAESDKNLEKPHRSVTSTPYSTYYGYGSDGPNWSKNSAFGYYALRTNGLLSVGGISPKGIENTAVGYISLQSNIDGKQNTSVGSSSLNKNTNGDNNIAVGFKALLNNIDGDRNIGIGSYALSSNNGNDNTASGYASLVYNQGSENTAHGSNALYFNTIGYGNTAVGKEALYGQFDFNTYVSLSTGSNNVALGYQANYKNTTGGGNTSGGYRSLYSNSTGTYNTASGYQSLYSNTTGGVNTGVGLNALFKNSNGSYNNALGYNALFNKVTGSYNLALGHEAGKTLTSGNYNVYLNNNSGLALESNTMRLGNPNATTGQTKTYISGIRGVSISGGVPVYIAADGKLGTVNSSARFKEDIQDMGKASSKLYDLRPVTYRYKDSPAELKAQRDYGLIAEEVEKVYPDLIAYDDQGQIQTVQYQKLVPMLLNEVQTLHRQNKAEIAKNQEQEKMIQAQQRQIIELKQLVTQVKILQQQTLLNNTRFLATTKD